MKFAVQAAKLAVQAIKLMVQVIKFALQAIKFAVQVIKFTVQVIKSAPPANKNGASGLQCQGSKGLVGLYKRLSGVAFHDLTN